MRFAMLDMEHAEEIRAGAPMLLEIERLAPSRLSLSLYGEGSSDEAELDALALSIEAQGILVPLIVTPLRGARREGDFEIVSGHRRWLCGRRLGLESLPCSIQHFSSRSELERAVIDYNRYRRKTFSQMMREADTLEAWEARAARRRQRAHLRNGNAAAGPLSTTASTSLPTPETPVRRNSDERAIQPPQRAQRTDERVARAIGLGGKDAYRQARAIWRAAASGDQRAKHALPFLDTGSKSIHSAYKDLRRRSRYTTDFRPTPYDVWSFRHDPAYGVPHPGSIPPGIVAHLLHYYTQPGSLVVDPMAGGGTTLDVCQAMERQCLAYDLHPVREDVRKHDINAGFPQETAGCDLVFADPPYFSMLAGTYAGGPGAVSELTLPGWFAFLETLARSAFQVLRPGGVLALLVANQTEKDLPPGFGYLDHAFYGLSALLRAGFLPERRVSCPMSGGYRPRQVQRARADGRLLGLVRDLLIVRRPADGLGAAVPARLLVPGESGVDRFRPDDQASSGSSVASS